MSLTHIERQEIAEVSAGALCECGSAWREVRVCLLHVGACAREAVNHRAGPAVLRQRSERGTRAAVATHHASCVRTSRYRSSRPRRALIVCASLPSPGTPVAQRRLSRASPLRRRARGAADSSPLARHERGRRSSRRASATLPRMPRSVPSARAAVARLASMTRLKSRNGYAPLIRLSPMMKVGVPWMPALPARSASLAISGRVACATDAGARTPSRRAERAGEPRKHRVGPSRCLAQRVLRIEERVVHRPELPLCRRAHRRFGRRPGVLVAAQGKVHVRHTRLAVVDVGRPNRRVRRVVKDLAERTLEVADLQHDHLRVRVAGNPARDRPCGEVRYRARRRSCRDRRSLMPALATAGRRRGTLGRLGTTDKAAAARAPRTRRTSMVVMAAG